MTKQQHVEDKEVAKRPVARFAALSSKLCQTTQQNLQRKGSEAADMDLHSLLLEAGATAPRREGGRWTCPVCAGRGRVAVDRARALFRCWTAGCAFHGSAYSLARRLGHETNAPEWLARAAAARRRLELEERAYALRVQACRAVGARFRAAVRENEALPAAVCRNTGQPDLLERALNVYADVLGLSAELLLLDVLPPLALCEFLGAPQHSRQAQIAEVVSQDGVLANGRFYELPPVRLRHTVAEVAGVPMSDGGMPRISEEGWQVSL